MIRASSRFFGVVSHLDPLGFPIDDQNPRVQVEDQTGTRFGEIKQPLSQLIVDHHYLANRFRRKSFEEAPEGRLIEKPGKPKELQKGAIVLKNPGLVDSP